MQKWKPGDLVSVATVNRGMPVIRKRTVETWHGVVVGPSLLGPGWWNVRQLTAKGGALGGSVFAVPDGEIRPRKR
jgi:hypothetical protein